MYGGTSEENSREMTGGIPGKIPKEIHEQGDILKRNLKESSEEFFLTSFLVNPARIFFPI